MRRFTLHGRKNILKRLLIHVGAFNISLVMPKILGAGRPLELKNRMARLVSGVLQCLIHLYRSESAAIANTRTARACLEPSRFITIPWNTSLEVINCTTGS